MRNAMLFPTKFKTHTPHAKNKLHTQARHNEYSHTANSAAASRPVVRKAHTPHARCIYTEQERGGRQGYTNTHRQHCFHTENKLHTQARHNEYSLPANSGRRQPSSREESPHAPCEVHIYRTRKGGGSSRMSCNRHDHLQGNLHHLQHLC
jgi:hypothetical protein